MVGGVPQPRDHPHAAALDLGGPEVLVLPGAAVEQQLVVDEPLGLWDRCRDRHCVDDVGTPSGQPVDDRGESQVVLGTELGTSVGRWWLSRAVWTPPEGPD